MGFIKDGECSMLGEAEADLRWKEERRAKLAQCKQNLENVPSTDTIYFLQVGWGKKELTMLYLGVLSHFPWSWGPGTLGCSGCRVTPVSTVLSPPLSQGDQAAEIFPSTSPTSVLSVTQERLMCCPEQYPGVGGREREVWGAPLAPPASPLPDSPGRGGDAAPCEVGMV